MTNNTKNMVEQIWDNSILPTLSQYVAIPCKSPFFDKNWQENGYIDQALELVTQWCHSQQIKGMEINVHRVPGRTPLLLIEVAGQSDETVVMYGHLDKQPEMTGWHEDLSPWNPVIKEDRLYGRGAADDGYAIFASLTAIKVLQDQGLPHSRCVIMIETCEESGSFDLPFYISHLEKQIRKPVLVIGLDSGCGNYEQLWVTASLRGMIAGSLTVEILTEGLHSGTASGVVPSSFRLLRQILSRIEDPVTGEILVDELCVDIPAKRIEEAKQVAGILGENVWTDYPWVEGAKPDPKSGDEMILNRTWKAALSITGVEGIPKMEDAGNVLRPKTTVMLSMRIPPGCIAEHAATALKATLERDPPNHAKVNFSIGKCSFGWNAPLTEKWLSDLLDKASNDYFQKPAVFWGEGGSIPFTYMLGNKFPEAQFVITGVLGPNSNAHGPNEFLDIPMAKKVTCSIADILHGMYNRKT